LTCFSTIIVSFCVTTQRSCVVQWNYKATPGNFASKTSVIAWVALRPCLRQVDK